MAEIKRWYIVAYDIRDPVRLRRVAKHLKGYGVRLQYSIFRCRLNDRQVARLDWELKKLMKKDDDLLLVGLCPTCLGRLKSKQAKPDWVEEESGFEIV